MPDRIRSSAVSTICTPERSFIVISNLQTSFFLAKVLSNYVTSVSRVNSLIPWLAHLWVPVTTWPCVYK